MRFDAAATTVETPATEAFAARHGVCQDFTHIMIIALRSLGIPAGYVSGYLRTLPPPGQERLEGADAMHAWVSAWCGPGVGWVEYDPTNAVFAGTDHIVVAYGRDYADVAPVRGAMRTAGGQTSSQSVDVAPVGA
jgi:transglutaminase-like putative cysteine protease